MLCGDEGIMRALCWVSGLGDLGVVLASVCKENVPLSLPDEGGAVGGTVHGQGDAVGFCPEL